MTQLTIIGLGTVGQSLGLALHASMQQTEGRAHMFTIVGYDPDGGAQHGGGVQSGAVDRVVGDLASALREAAFVIVATPTWQIYDVFRNMASLVVPGATVTDTA